MADITDPTDQLLAKGRASLNQSVSEAMVALSEGAIQKYFADVFNAQLPQGVLNARLSDSAVVAQFLLLSNAKVYTLSFPHVMMTEQDGTFEEFLVGSLSDKLCQVTPVAIPLDRARAWVSTLAPRGLLEE